MFKALIGDEDRDFHKPPPTRPECEQAGRIAQLLPVYVVSRTRSGPLRSCCCHSNIAVSVHLCVLVLRQRLEYQRSTKLHCICWR